MYQESEDIFYYITIGNENYAHGAMPEGVREDILKGMYRFQAAPDETQGPRVQLLGSGTIFNEVRKAAATLLEKYGVHADIWGVTSYKELHRDAQDSERWNRLHPDREPRVSHVTQCLGQVDAPVIAASDYVKALPDAIARWVPTRLTSLGTDGFGRSDGREALREFFEVSDKHIVYTALVSLAAQGRIDKQVVLQARDELGINVDKPNPVKV